MGVRPPSRLVLFLVGFVAWLAILAAAAGIIDAAAEKYPTPLWSPLLIFVAAGLSVIGMMLVRELVTFIRNQPTFSLHQSPPAFCLVAAMLPKRYAMPNICVGCGAEPTVRRKVSAGLKSGNAEMIWTMEAPFCASCDTLAKWSRINGMRLFMLVSFSIALLELCWFFRSGTAALVVLIASIAAVVFFSRAWSPFRYYSPVGSSGEWIRFACREFVTQIAEMNHLSARSVDLGPA